jgi:methyl-accepting chemotaxis protein
MKPMINETGTAVPSSRRAARFPLVWKISLLVGLTLTISSVVMGLVQNRYFASILEQEARGRAKAIATTLASALVEMPDSAVASTVQAVKKDAGVAYIEVVAANGSILAHTFEGKAPIQQTSQLREGEKINDVVLDGVSFIDVPATVLNGTLVHVGLDPAVIRARLQEAQTRAVLLTLIALVAALTVAYIIVRRIIEPLRKLTHVASRVVEGDLTLKVEVDSNDEIGEMASAFGMMLGTLKETVGALQDSVKLLKEAGNDLSLSTSEQGETITRQATALQETQVTAQEIKQTSLLAAQKAEAVLRLTEEADAVSASGEQALESTLGGLTDIRAQVDEIAQKITQLSERTAQIGGITQTVKDLADQSNMLALNAAIEAVRSGEHGKGFAVVAREIRSLADQSIQATNRVREILEDISGSIRGAVAITERGSQKIEGGLGQVKQSGENLRQLSNIVKDNSSAVRQIAAAVSQQNAGITQIFSAVTDQTKMMDETMRRLETTTTAAGVLKDLSERVSDVVRRFQL